MRATRLFLVSVRFLNLIVPGYTGEIVPKSVPGSLLESPVFLTGTGR